MSWMENAKEKVAKAAAKLVQTGSVIGLGSGTTVAYALKEIGRRIREDRIGIHGVPTSYQTYLLAIRHKIPITTLDEHPRLDLMIDGADQVNKSLDMIKGMGGALTREKIVASASKQNVIAIDDSKLTTKLGERQLVPIEVLPFALPTVKLRLRSKGGKTTLRNAQRKLGPVVSDNGNFILDTDFGVIREPAELNQELKLIPGIVETGLFINMADIVFVGGKSSVKKLEKKRESA